jgi:hypothetical protein
MEYWCNDSNRGRGTYLKKTAPVPQFLPKIPQGLTPDRTEAGVVLKTIINLHYTHKFRTHLTHNTVCIRCKNQYVNIVLLTYLLTPWCSILPEQLTGLQLVKKFPTFHGTRRFITALTSVRHR